LEREHKLQQLRARHQPNQFTCDGDSLETFETNFFGTVGLTQYLLSLLRKATAARIVNVASMLGSLTLHSDPAPPIYSHKVFA
jgi:short-subunit dehydrogenase involved in D-alanine esterification of teichoic acids